MTIIADIAPVSVRVSDNTVWTFVRVRTVDGVTGIGEATVPGAEREIWLNAAAFGATLIGRSADPRIEVFAPLARRPRALVPDAVASAIDAALWDIEAQRRGLPLAAL